MARNFKWLISMPRTSIETVDRTFKTILTVRERSNDNMKACPLYKMFFKHQSRERGKIKDDIDDKKS
jgi:hypothetical protein